jgi:iron complex outermembrane receptor protein
MRQPHPRVWGPFGHVAALGLLLLAAALPVRGHAQVSAPEAAEEDGVREPDPGEEPGGTPGEADSPAGTPVAPPADVEVIRVTGRGIAAIQTEVPTSVTQFDAAALEALGAQNVSDLAKVTPNVEIRTSGATTATFYIRGVGLSDFSANAAGAVAIYQDDVPLNAPALQISQLYDVENVEVLRGPQGSGDYRNASAGAIKIYARKPSGDFTADLRSTLARYESPDAKRAFIQDYEGALELPLVSEMLSSRLAFRFLDADPFMTNGCGDGRPCGHLDQFLIPGLPTDVGDRGNWAARGQLRFQPPGTEMDWLLNLHGGRLDQQSTLGQAIGTAGTGAFGAAFGSATKGTTPYIEPDQFREKEELCAAQGVGIIPANGRCRNLPGVPGPAGAAPENAAQPILEERLAEERPLDREPYRGDYDRVGQTELDVWGGFLRGEIPLGSVPFLGAVQLRSISGYDAYDRFRDTDQDFTASILFEGAQEDNAWQFTQDLRLSGELPDTPLRWETGAYFLMEQLDGNNDQDILGTGTLNSFFREFSQDLYSSGVYAGFSWDFLDDFTLEGGARYNWEQKRFELTELRTAGTPPPPTCLTPTQPEKCFSQGETTWTAPTGSLSLIYRLSEESNVYWKYSRGFKPGHYNTNEVGADPAEPEFIDAFEVGMRGRYLDGRFSLGGALFYYEYTGYQVFIFEDNPGLPPTLEVINANDAEVYGAEIDLRLEPLAGWAPDLLDDLILSSRFGWLESQFLDFSNEVVRFDNLSGREISFTIDYSGNQLINSPTFKLSGAAEWPFDLGRWGTIVPRYDFAWSDAIFFDPTEGRGSPDFRGETDKPEYAVGQAPYWLHNLRLAYRTPAGNMEIAAWCRNLLDERYKVYAFDASFFAGVVVNFVGEPRTIGLDVIFHW